MANQKLPSNILLPDVINYIKGQNVFGLLFESDIDKATYFLGKFTGFAGSGGFNEKNVIKSQKKQEVWDWLQKVTGWNEGQRWEHRKVILEEIRKLTKANPDEFIIKIPDLYNKEKPIPQKVEEPEEEIPPELLALLDELSSESKQDFDFPGYSYSQFLENYPGGTSKKPEKKKRERRKSGQLTKRQEQILQNILEDLIKIKNRLVEIKTNQEDKIAYEKRRDRLNAERLAFLERERQIEALPDSKSDSGNGTSGTRGPGSSSQQKKEQSFLDKLTSGFRNIFNIALLSGAGNTLLSGGGNQQQPQDNNPFSTSNISKTALKMLPIPGINMIPFAEGGTITPIGNNASSTQIRPLESEMGNGPSGSTTYSRGFSMEDLKSPLAEVMKLPLKVAGAALLSAISKLSDQFDISDPKLQSDLSKMIGDISKAFGLNRPSFGTRAAITGIGLSLTGGADNEQVKLINEINTASRILIGDNQTEPNPTPTPTNQNPQSPDSGDQGTASSSSGSSGASSTSSNASQPSITVNPDGSRVTNPPTTQNETSTLGGSNAQSSSSLYFSNPENNSGMPMNTFGEKSYQPVASSSTKIEPSFSYNPKMGSTIFNSGSLFADYSQSGNNFSSSLTVTANRKYFSDVERLNADPSNSTSFSMAVALGANPMADKEILNNPNPENIIINSPQPPINNTQPVPNSFSKPPSGFNGQLLSITAAIA